MAYELIIYKLCTCAQNSISETFQYFMTFRTIKQKIIYPDNRCSKADKETFQVSCRASPLLSAAFRSAVSSNN